MKIQELIRENDEGITDHLEKRLEFADDADLGGVGEGEILGLQQFIAESRMEKDT